MNSFIQKIEQDFVLEQVKPFIKDVDAFVVGGFVRDILMGKTSPDRDLIVCNCDVKQFSKNLADKLNGHYIELDTLNNIYRIVLEDKINYIDVTCPIENDFEKDIKRRDLTINAIAYDLKNSKFIDLVGGIEDIKNQKICSIEDKNFEDDPLRLIRIFRFYAKTGFKIDKALIELSKKLCKRINEPAKERVNVELLKLFEGEYSELALIEMDNCGLLEELFPIYKEVKKVPKNSHHHLPLIGHLVETVKQVQLLYSNATEEVKIYLENKNYGGVSQLAFLKLSAFLHDIGKPSTWTIEEETGRHRFIKHDDVGSQLVVPILKEFKFSKKQIEYVKMLIKYHIYPSGLFCSEDVTDKAIMKFYRKMDGYVIDVIMLAMADRLSARGEQITDEIVEKNINSLTKLLNDYLSIQKDIKPLPKLLDGLDIMEILQIKQGPELGKIINELKEAQISGMVNDKQEAIDFVKSLFR